MIAAQMEVTPVVLKDVVYDTHARSFHCSEKPTYPLKSFDHTIPFSSPRDVSGTYEVTRPTYVMNYLHSCIGHAYLDTTIPLLSILDEYDSEVLAKRGFQLFVLRDMFSTTDPQLSAHLARWEKNTIDYSTGSYKGPYQHFHKCFSDSPIIFEKAFSTHRYIRFSSLIFGGNIDWQRAIHNCEAKYPERKMVPVTSDEQISRWISLGKIAFSRYIGLEKSVPSKTLLIARKGTREFTGLSLRKLISILDTEPIFLEDYSFEEQIQLFSEAKLVVSAHGSGLCHLLWCSGARVIEIFATDDSRKRIFQSLAEFLKLDYTRIECSQDERTTDEPIDVPDWALKNIESLNKDA
jgi:hypothetical protein